MNIYKSCVLAHNSHMYEIHFHSSRTQPNGHHGFNRRRQIYEIPTCNAFYSKWAIGNAYVLTQFVDVIVSHNNTRTRAAHHRTRDRNSDRRLCRLSTNTNCNPNTSFLFVPHRHTHSFSALATLLVRPVFTQSPGAIPIRTVHRQPTHTHTVARSLHFHSICQIYYYYCVSSYIIRISSRSVFSLTLPKKVKGRY